jgi:hypothetical protein
MTLSGQTGSQVRARRSDRAAGVVKSMPIRLAPKSPARAGSWCSAAWVLALSAIQMGVKSDRAMCASSPESMATRALGVNRIGMVKSTRFSNVCFWPKGDRRRSIASVCLESQADTERVRSERQLRALNRPLAEVSLFQKPKPFPERAEDP